jgi:ribosomal protein S18 acetylase RimI-like enzyme
LSAYRFCRTDDIGLLVDALNRCWAPYFPDEPPMTPAEFKRSIRDLQVWCSSCMVAFSGADPIGVLIGAKRTAGTLIHRIAVHPDHVRQGHGRHLLTSLSSKLAILGPPRIVAEVPETSAAARRLFEACGYVEETVLTDYVLDNDAEITRRERAPLESASRMVIPVTIDDLAANGLLDSQGPVCWERSVETLMARKAEIEGLAVASDERIEAYILYIKETNELLAVHGLVDGAEVHMSRLMYQLRSRGLWALRFLKVHPAEVSPETLQSLGFHSEARHRRYAASARSG